MDLLTLRLTPIFYEAFSITLGVGLAILLCVLIYHVGAQCIEAMDRLIASVVRKIAGRDE